MENKRLGDWMLGAAVGVVSFVFLCVWSFPGLHPSVWSDVAVGAGVEPPQGLLPGFGPYVSGLFFRLFPFATALAVTGFLAKLAVAACGALAYGLFSDMMYVVSGVGARDWKRRPLAIRMAALTAAFVFVFSDPLGRAAQGLTGPTLEILLTVAAGACFLRTLRTARPAYAVLTLALTGLLAAESPLGWIVLILELVVTTRFLDRTPSDEWKDFLDPVKMQRTKWLMTFAFLGALFAGAALEMVAYAKAGGLGVEGLAASDLPLAYLDAYWARIVGSMSIAGLCLFLLCGVVPFLLTTVMIAPATDEDRYLPFGLCIVYVLSGLVAFLPLSPFDALWMWNLAGLDGFVSGYLVLFSTLLGSVALAWGLFVLGVEVFCRDYEHVEHVLYQYAAEDDPPQADSENVTSVRLSPLRLAALLIPLALFVLSFGGRRLPDDRALCATVWSFVNETLTEAAGARYLLTDGAFDSALRLEARRRGLALTPLSLAGGASRRDVALRQAGTTDREDRLNLEVGAAEALRVWATERKSRLGAVAVQVADEILRLDPDAKPMAYGTLLRPAGGDETMAEQSVVRCRRLAERLLDCHEKGVWRHAKDAQLKDLVLFAQFRLAVQTRVRALLRDAKKDPAAVEAELARADRLDAANPSLAETVRRLDWVRRQTGEGLTPREGLAVALQRADFAMARRYALPLLRETPDDPSANFAVGMSYAAEGQDAKAEDYLTRALRKLPDEPAILNNLALLRLKAQRLDEAAKDAAKALERAPASVEIRETVRRIRAAQAARPPSLPAR